MLNWFLHSLFLAILCLLLHSGDSYSVSNSSQNLAYSKESCDPNWFSSPNGKKCYKYISHSDSWDKSETYCKSSGGTLAAITSPEELQFLQKLCGEVTKKCWVGGKSSNTTGGLGWNWSDGTSDWNGTLTPNMPDNSNCQKSPCSSLNAVDFCTLLTNRTSKLIAQSCNVSHPFICMLNAGSKCHHMRCHREYLIILEVVSGLILCSTMAVVAWLLIFKRSIRRKRSCAELALVPPSWKIFTREEIKSITKNFSEANRLAGDAKTGGTYGGVFPDGSKVAVKRLKRSGFQKKKEFYSEVGRAARLHHPNLVVIKGCCYHHSDRYIVYEFISNGPLDRWLHHIPRGGRCLDWTMRMSIATSLAQGIAFLHDKVKPQVVHRDIRASNVLLDEDFGAHLMGVGLSKFVPWEVMQERRVMAGGTHGYLAPEFVYKNELTTKSDVYSFGVLLLEIVSGRRPAQLVDSVGWQSIFEWATPLVQAHHYMDLLDPLISSSSSSSSQVPEVGAVQKVVDLVYSCTQHVPSMRPRMSHVVHQLQQLAHPPPIVKNESVSFLAKL
ncbi:unnamed protein product [Cuscuta epithymum]|uniref:C-type lectin receptor-like tyrosine-protein kinase At1g52310 n=1 Tax=Cuscuta epithymum TaxID=186058 RepID=A0AAV0DVC5_9ASTE|nr:unnamed protein product [Cuscuta epithymum]CAH9141279.1 unnamed protein product [Cuscuta epithymum]